MSGSIRYAGGRAECRDRQAGSEMCLPFNDGCGRACPAAQSGNRAQNAGFAEPARRLSGTEPGREAQEWSTSPVVVEYSPVGKDALQRQIVTNALHRTHSINGYDPGEPRSPAP